MKFVNHIIARNCLLALAMTCSVITPGWSEKWHVFDRSSGLTSESVYTITETLDGKLWGGTLEGLFYFDGNIWQEEPIDGHLGLQIPKIEATSDGALWVEIKDPDRWFDGWSRAYTLARFQDGEWDWIPAAFEDKTYRVIDSAESTNGDVWITYDEWSPTTVGSNGKIAVYRNGALEQIDTNELIDIDGVWLQGIIPRSDGGVWIYAKIPGHAKMPGKSSNMVDGPIDWLLSFDGANWSNTPLQDVMPWIATRIPGGYSDFALISGGYELTDGTLLFEVQKEELFSWMDGLVYHDPEQGLWHRMVSSVVKDPNGQIFAGLEVSDPNPAFVNTAIQDYAYIGPNEFWFATNRYVAHVVGNDTTRFSSTVRYVTDGVNDTTRTIAGLAADNCGLLMATTDGSIWVGHKSEGTLSRYRNGTWRTYSTADGLTGAQLTTFYETHDGSFVVGTTKGVVMLVSSPEAMMVSPNGIPIELIGEDAEGQVWSFDERTVYKHAASGTIRFPGMAKIIGGLITNRGDVWIINAKWLYRWTGDSWRQYSRKNDLEIQSIHAWSETEEGEFLVAGANTNEIRIYNTVEDKFTPWADVPGEISSNSIHSMTRDNSGNRYFATDEGLALFSEGAWTSFTTEDGIADNAIVDVLADDEGNLWCATTMGVSRYDGNSWQTFRGDGDLVNTNATRIAAGPDGDLWFATQQGLSRYFSGAWTSFTLDDGLADRSINDVAVTPDGTVWAATNKGLSRYTDGIWKTYTTVDGIVHNHITSLAVANDGSVWVGTSGGVSRLKDEMWSSWTTDDGFLSDQVLSISPGLDNTMWVTTNILGGVHRINQDERIDTIPVGEYQQVYQKFGLDCENIPAVDPTPDFPITDPYTCYNAIIRRVYEEPGMGTWFITDQSGALFQDLSGAWQHNFKSERVNAIYSGPDETLWLSTTVAGVHFVQTIAQGSRSVYSCGIDVGLGMVSRFYRQKTDGSIWTVHDYLDNHRTPGRRLSRWSNNSWQVFDLTERLDPSYGGKYLDYLKEWNAGYNFLTASFDFVEGDESSLRIFDNQPHHSALEFDGSNWTQPSALGSSNFDFNRQNSIVFDHNNAAWHATATGLFRISEEGFIQVKLDDGSLSGEVRDLFLQKNNVLWISTVPTQETRAIYRMDLNNPPIAYTLFTDSIDKKIGTSSQSFRIRTGELGTTEVRPFTYALVPGGTEVSPFDWSPLIRDDLIRLSGLDNGEWDLYVRAMGSFGQFDSTPARASFTVDVTPPTAIINTPSTGDIIGNQVVVTGSAFDQSPLEDFAKYTLEYITGTIAEVQQDTDWIPITPSITDEVIKNTLGVWDVSALSGNYLLRVWASDDLGHRSQYVVSVMVDNTPPLVELDPVDADSTYSGTIAIQGTIGDEHPAEYQVGYRRLSTDDNQIYPIYTGPIEEISDNQLAVWDSSDETGAIQLVVTAFDQANNSSDPAEIIVHLDNNSALPQAEITYPQADAVLSGVAKIRGRLTDTRFSHYQLEVLDSDSAPFPLKGLYPVQPGEFVLADFDTRELDDGSYSFNLAAFNTEGYTRYFDVAFTIDNTPPEARIEYPVDADTLRGWIEVEGKISDEHLSSYQLSYGPGPNPPESEMTILDSGSESTVEHSVAWNTLALYGQYTLVLAGMDAAGLSSTQRRSVWIENPPISASEGGSREFDMIRIFIPPGSPSEDMALGVRTYDTDPTLDPGSEDLRVAGRPFEIMSSPSAINLRRPATLRVPYEHTAAADKLALFRLGSDQAWQRIGGTLNQGENTISTAIDSFGTFVLLEDHREYGSSAGKLSNLQCQPRMISPRGGWTEQAQISFRLSDLAPVSVMVYNMAGQRKKTLLDATLNTGVHSIEWSGRDHNGNLVEDGMYIVMIKTPGTVIKQVIGVVNGGT